MRPFLIVLLTFYVCVHAFGQIQVGVWTDKPSYRYGDTIAITITAYNPTADTIFLHFGSTCQANYIIDNFNFYNNIACAAKVTGRYIPPSGTITWDFLKYPYSLSGWPLLSLGAHAVLTSPWLCDVRHTSDFRNIYYLRC